MNKQKKKKKKKKKKKLCARAHQFPGKKLRETKFLFFFGLTFHSLMVLILERLLIHIFKKY